MKIIFASLLAIMLSGCGSIGSYKNPEETSFVILSEFNAGLIYKIFNGAVKSCKISMHNIILGETSLGMDEEGNCVMGAEIVSE